MSERVTLTEGIGLNIHEETERGDNESIKIGGTAAGCGCGSA